MLVDVFAARKEQEVMRDTWGHLEPVPRHSYPGFIVFCVTPMGDHLLLDYDFDGLDGNPWTLEHVTDWWSDETRSTAYEPSEAVKVWRWDGRYLVQKNGAPRFSGKIAPMRLVAIATNPEPKL